MKNESFFKQPIATLFIIGILLLSGTGLYAQQKIEVVKGGEVTIESKILKEERTVSVHLPGIYNLTNQSFPVLYLLDGKGHFQHSKAAVNFLTIRNYMPQIIVVAIHNVDRNRDFSPVHEEQFPSSGGGENFLDFIENELTPFINKNYRTSDFSLIMGHSFGGTIITYSLLTRPELFDGYISISPYLFYANNYIIDLADKKLQPSYNSKKFYYMTIGDEPAYFESLDKFSSLVQEKSATAINLEYKMMKNENHGTIPYISLFNGLRFMFSDWQLPNEVFNKGLAAIDGYYNNLSKKYGYETVTPEIVINQLGYTYLQNKELNKAIEIFTENTKRYPQSANVYDSLGEGFEKNNQLNKAKTNYKKACNLGKEQNHFNTPIYLKNLNRVKKKINPDNS
ncbi:MAG: alpha/beta hydrolase-fold protein [Bacteroidota bacterium]